MTHEASRVTLRRRKISRAGGIAVRLALAAAGTLLALQPLQMAAAAPAGAGSSAATFYAARVQPIFDQACVSCHGPEKTRGGLQLHSFAALSRGGEQGEVVSPGSLEKSELQRRIALAPDHEEAMPPEGKRRLSVAQAEIIRRWIQAGATAEIALGEIDLAGVESVGPVAAAPDHRPFAAELLRLEKALSVKFVPVSENPTDGLILRTVSAARSVDDRVVEKIASVAALIVDAELARTRITDAAFLSIAGLVNLRRLDVAHTAITSAGVARLERLGKLDAINLVGTGVDDSAWVTLRGMPQLRRIHVFGTKMTTPSE